MRTMIILPYFGKFNSYFRLWLDSCSRNQEFEWMIVTDIAIKETIPSNVRIVSLTLSELKEQFQKKMNVFLTLKDAYKLCDYKQFYGYLFSEYLVGYDYWGYCDCDLVFGKIKNFLTSDLQFSYDKLFRTGHFSVIRNDVAINELFFKYNTYKITLTSPVIYGYDESITGYHLGFAGELLDCGYKFFDCAEWIADIDFRHYPFYEKSNPPTPCVFSYERGRVFRIDWNDGNLVKSEKMYVHLQKRMMDVEDGINPDCYLICPNKFLKYNEEILASEKFWKQVMQEKAAYFDYEKEWRRNKIRDIKRFLHEPQKIKSILYRLKGQ